MNLRAALLAFVATPDRAWLMLLAGSLLIARECVAPGRIVPGMLGGIMLLTAGLHLPQAIPGVMVCAVCLAIQARHRAWHLPSIVAAVSAIVAARQARAGWPAALASVLVITILTVLIRIAVLAHKRKTWADSGP